MQETIREISHLERVCACSRRRRKGERPKALRKDGVAHFGGLQHCGSIWSCALCGPKIRQERAEEINYGLARHIANGGSVHFLTLTAPHDFGEPLKAVNVAIGKAFNAIVSGRAWQQDRKAFGIVGYIRAYDVLYGPNGWHVHLHVVVCTSRELTPRELTKLRRRLYVRWSRSIVGKRGRAGKRPKPDRAPGWRQRRDRARNASDFLPSYRVGVQIEQARSVADVARYAAAVAGNVESETKAVVVRERARLGLEVARSDLKHGGDGLLTPWEILGLIRDTPAADADGVVSEQRERLVAVWWEWDEEMHGKRGIRWSAGLKALLGVIDRTDEDIAEEKLGGEEVHEFSDVEWWAVCATRGASVRALELVERGGAPALLAWLAVLVPAWYAKRQRDQLLELRLPRGIRGA